MLRDLVRGFRLVAIGLFRIVLGLLKLLALPVTYFLARRKRKKAEALAGGRIGQS
jgi:hypothetical protein